MFRPLPLFVGLRYVRARTHKFFVSFITWVSLLGVCLGVAALIVVLSVMNGFEGELRDRLLALSAHARVIVAPDAAGLDPATARARLDRVLEQVRATPGVQAAAPYVEVQALAVHQPEMLPVQLRGIDPALEPGVTDAARSVFDGSLELLTPGSDRVIVGVVVAQKLGLGVGDSLTVLVPTVSADGAPAPRLREFTVAGLFEVGLQDHDGVLVLGDLESIRSLVADDARAGGVRFTGLNALDAPALAATIGAALPADLEVRDWTQDHANYFRAIRIEKTMMSLILMLIVGVAAFNIVAMLVMVVTDKRNDIAILRTLGTSPQRVMGVFLTQGLVIGWFGVVLGVTLGVTLALNVDTVLPAVESLFGFRLMDPDVYYITVVPSVLDWGQVGWIAALALVLTGAATVYPALRAARVAPAEALRYE